MKFSVKGKKTWLNNVKNSETVLPEIITFTPKKTSNTNLHDTVLMVIRKLVVK